MATLTRQRLRKFSRGRVSLMSTWTIDSFEPSNDPKRDQIAWLRKELPAGSFPTSAHVLVQMASVGLSEAEARAIVETMVTALNSAGA